MVAAVAHRQDREPTATLTASSFDLDQSARPRGRIASDCDARAMAAREGVERDDLLREAAALLKAARLTADPQEAEELTQRAHVLIALDGLDARHGYTTLH